jgi:ornithine carbamoyltransferase
VLSDSLRGRDFLRVNDWSADELRSVLDLAESLKAMQKAREPHPHLAGRTVGLVFDKPSTRTRVSFGVGIAQLGAVGLPLSAGQLQLGRGEPISDTARILSLYLDAIVIRTFRQADVDELAAAADVPVINGLTDEFHPCQALADVMTIRERFGALKGIRVAYLGDGNNVCHSLMVACAKLGLEFVAATPDGYESDGSVSLLHDPRAAAAGADVLYTDVWTSMGQEDESERRLRDLRDYTIDRDAVSLASDRAIVMHCLPAHRGEEIAADVLEGPRSAVWDQAENRLHAQKALMALVIP